jgi:hypothetical protein
MSHSHLRLVSHNEHVEAGRLSAKIIKLRDHLSFKDVVELGPTGSTHGYVQHLKALTPQLFLEEVGTAAWLLNELYRMGEERDSHHMGVFISFLQELQERLEICISVRALDMGTLEPFETCPDALELKSELVLFDALEKASPYANTDAYFHALGFEYICLACATLLKKPRT